MVFWILCLIPLIGAQFILFFPNEKMNQIKYFSLSLSLITFGFNIYLIQYPLALGHWNWGQIISWYSKYGIDWSVHVDGMSMSLLLLSTLLIPISILGSFNSINKHIKGFYYCILLLESAVIGVFITSNLWVFYLFWEMMLIPMYFLIGVWGGKERIHASIKFILFTLAGSLIMLVGILSLGYLHLVEYGSWNFSIFNLSGLHLSSGIQNSLFICFFIAFAVKIPIVPFHTWLPDAHSEAPTAGSVLLAAVLLKMGLFGFIRICIPIFPLACLSASFPISFLGGIGIIYGALLAWSQKDIKRCIAYTPLPWVHWVN